MSEKPRKRLVHWQEYAETKVSDGIGYGFSLLAGSVGILFLVVGVGIIWLGSSDFEGPSTIGSRIFFTVAGIVFVGLSIAAMCAAKAIITAIRDTPPVQLVTKEAARHLTSAEILVRPSDISPAHQQAELLRAAKPGQETPPEELLRATANRDNEA
jgi:hypothetical protein